MTVYDCIFHSQWTQPEVHFVAGTRPPPFFLQVVTLRLCRSCFHICIFETLAIHPGFVRLRTINKKMNTAGAPNFAVESFLSFFLSAEFLSLCTTCERYCWPIQTVWVLFRYRANNNYYHRYRYRYQYFL